MLQSTRGSLGKASLGLILVLMLLSSLLVFIVPSKVVLASPDTSTYKFTDTENNKAWDEVNISSTLVAPASVPSSPRTEATSTEYTNISSSNNVYWDTTGPEFEYEIQYFKFKIFETISQIDNLTVKWEGKGTDEPASFFIYKSSTSTWILLGTNATGVEATIENIFTSNISDYIYENTGAGENQVWLASRSQAPGSCPVFYSWNGEEWVWVAEASPGGGLAFPSMTGEEGRQPSHPIDYIPISGSDISIENGLISFLLREDQYETTYIDQVKLYGVIHPSDTEVYSATTVQVANPPPSGTIHTVKNPESVRAWKVENGELIDISTLIEKEDEIWYNFDGLGTWGFISKYAPDNYSQIILDLGDLREAEQIKLLVKARTLWSYEINKYPFAEVWEDGEWVKVEDRIDSWAEASWMNSRVYAVDITNWFNKNTENYLIRVNDWRIKAYDYIAVDTSEDDFELIEIPLRSVGDLEETGFLATMTSTGEFDYYKKGYFDWRGRFAGWFTKTGDVGSLLEESDDMFVVMAPGDQIKLEFEGIEFDDYVLYTDAFYKEEWVKYLQEDNVLMTEPYPFHDMSYYPPPDNENFPWDEEHLKWKEEYQTRYIEPGWEHETLKTDYVEVEVNYTLPAPPDNPPTQPSLTYPTDGLFTNDNTPIFEWSLGENAWNGHRLLVDNDSDFSSPEENRTSGGGYTSTTNDGYLFAIDADYTTTRDASSADYKYDATISVVIGQRLLDANYYIYRGYLYFDTSDILENFSITSATISLYGKTDWSDTDFAIVIQDGQETYPSIPLANGDYDRTYYSDNGGSISTSDFSITGYNDIILNATGRGWINKEGITKLCLRSSNDIDNIAPTGEEIIDFYSNEKGYNYKPLLIIQDRLGNTYTITADNSLPDDNYSWKVIASNNQGDNESTVRTFVIDTVAPSTPTLLSPENNSSTYDTTPTFTWTEPETPEKYTLVVDNDNDFGSPTQTINNITDNTYTLVTPLAIDTYYWRVKMIDQATNESGWTDNFKLTILVKPTQPSLYKPDNDSITVDDTPYFEWTEGENTDNHRFLLDNDSDFSSPKENRVFTTENGYTIPVENDLDNGIFYWKVVAQAEGGDNESVTWMFNLYDMQPENRMILVDNTPTFSNFPGSTPYQLYVSRYEDFRELLDNENLSTGSWTKSSPGYSPGRYFWKVKSDATWWELYKFEVHSIFSTADAYVSIQYPDNNYNNENLYLRQGGTGTTYTRICLKFDLSNIPSNFRHYSLNIYLHDVSPVESSEFRIYKAGDSWAEDNITFNNMPTGISLDTELTISSSIGWKSFQSSEMDSYISSQVESDNVITLVLEPQVYGGQTNEFWFYSKEASDYYPTLSYWGANVTTLSAEDVGASSATLRGTYSLDNFHTGDNIIVRFAERLYGYPPGTTWETGTYDFDDPLDDWTSWWASDTRWVAADDSSESDKAFVEGKGENGWVCDGNNDEDNIQQAIDNLPDAGGRVELMAGTYNFDSPWAWNEQPQTKNNWILYGKDGAENTILYAKDYGEGIRLFFMTAGIDGPDNMVFFDLTFEGDMTKTGERNAFHFGADDGSNYIWENCRFINLPGTTLYWEGVPGSTKPPVENIYVYNNYFENLGESAFLPVVTPANDGGNGMRKFYVIGNTFIRAGHENINVAKYGGASTPIMIWGAADGVIANNVIENSAGVGIRILAYYSYYSTVPPDNILIYGNEIKDAGSILRGSENWAGGIMLTNYSIGASEYYSTNITIRRNKIYSSEGITQEFKYGILVGTGDVPSENVIVDNNNCVELEAIWASRISAIGNSAVENNLGVYEYLTQYSNDEGIFTDTLNKSITYRHYYAEVLFEDEYYPLTPNLVEFGIQLLNVYVSTVDVTPQTYFTISVEVFNSEMMQDFSEIQVRLFENSKSWDSPDNLRDHYDFRFTLEDNFWEYGPSDNTHMDKENSIKGQDNLVEDNFTFRIKLGGSASPSLENWNIWVKITENEAATDNNQFDNQFGVSKHFEIEQSTDTLKFGGYPGSENNASYQNPVTLTIATNYNFNLTVRITGDFTNENENLWFENSDGGSSRFKLTTSAQTSYSNIPWGEDIIRYEYYFIDIPIEIGPGKYFTDFYTEYEEV